MTEFRMLGLGVYRRRDGGLKTIKDHYPDNVFPWGDEQEDDYSDGGEVICGGGVDDLVECVWLFLEADQPESVKSLKEYQDYIRQNQPASVRALNLTPKPIPLAEMTKEDFEGLGMEYNSFRGFDDEPDGLAEVITSHRGLRLEVNGDYACLELSAPHVNSDILRQLVDILKQAGQSKGA